MFLQSRVVGDLKRSFRLKARLLKISISTGEALVEPYYEAGTMLQELYSSTSPSLCQISCECGLAYVSFTIGFIDVSRGGGCTSKGVNSIT